MRDTTYNASAVPSAMSGCGYVGMTNQGQTDSMANPASTITTPPACVSGAPDGLPLPGRHFATLAIFTGDFRDDRAGRAGWGHRQCGAADHGGVAACLGRVIRVGRQQLDLLRSGPFRISIIASVCCFAGQMASYIALPFYLEHSLGQDAIATGLYMTPWPLVVAVAGPISGRLASRSRVACCSP